jgi:hypothetical protein
MTFQIGLLRIAACWWPSFPRSRSRCCNKADRGVTNVTGARVRRWRCNRPKADMGRNQPEQLFARRETANAGCGQAKFSEPPHRIAHGDKTLPVQLRNLALGLAVADLAQGIEFFRS